MSEQWRAAQARSDAIRAARPWVRTVDVIPGVKPVPVGAVGREAWRGRGAGDQAGVEWVQVIFEGFGARDCRPDQLVPSEPGDEGKLFRS